MKKSITLRQDPLLFECSQHCANMKGSFELGSFEMTGVINYSRTSGYLLARLLHDNQGNHQNCSD